MRFFLTSTILSLSFLAPTSAQAQGLVSSCEGATCSACDIISLANNIIQWLVGIVFLFFAILAVYHGFKLVVSGGDSGAKSAAKSGFTSAFIGLFIMLGAFLVVDTIMRGVVRGSDGEIEGYGPWAEIKCAQQTAVGIQTVEFDEEDFSTYIIPSGGVTGGGTGTGPAKTLTLANGTTVSVIPCEAGAADRVSVPFLGHSATVHKNLAPSLRRIDARWRQLGGNSFYRVTYVGGYSCRPIAGKTTLSNHSYALSIDINPPLNPHCPTWAQCNGRNILITNMPTAFIRLFREEGWGWGGNWRTSKDAMHFSKLPNEGGNARGE
jgi:D-alanyl-D-alanine carboxypeptidase/Type IV secretion system pilin